MPRSYYASASKAAQPASGYADGGVLQVAAEHNSDTEDMQTPALLNQDLAGWEPTQCNIKKDIFAPLNAKCVWNEDTKKWTVPANEEVLTSICNWESALGSNYPRGQQVTKCAATFFVDEADSNQYGKPRLDIVVTFSNGLQVRFHPQAKPIWSTEQQPTKAMEARMQLMRKQCGLVPPKQRRRR